MLKICTSSKTAVQATLTFLVACVACVSAAAANEPPENDETCARLSGLIAAPDLERILRRKLGAVMAATASQYNECSLDLNVPNAKTVAPEVAAITFTLRQHVSERDARAAVQNSVNLAGGPERVKEIARDERGNSYLLKFGYDYVYSSVDATEITVLVRDKSLIGATVASQLGELVFRRALASETIANYSVYSYELSAFTGIYPMLKFVMRCVKDDIPAHQDVRLAFASSALSKVQIVSIEEMSPYSQRWIAFNQLDVIVQKRSAPIERATCLQLAGECAKMSDGLRDFEQTLSPKFFKALTKLR